MPRVRLPGGADLTPGSRFRYEDRARAWLESDTTGFADDDGILAGASALLAAGHASEEAADRETLQSALHLLGQVRSCLHRRLAETGRGVLLADTAQTAGLSEVETEVLLLLTLGSMGVSAMSLAVHDLDDLQRRMAPCEVDPLAVARAVAPGSALVQAGLVTVTEGERPVDARIAVSADLLQSLWHGAHLRKRRFRSLEDAFAQLRPLAYTAARHLRRSEDEDTHDEGLAPAAELPLALALQLMIFQAGLEEHPDWQFTRTLVGLEDLDAFVLLLLLTRELGYQSPQGPLYRGHGIASCLSRRPSGVPLALERLRRGAPLREQGLVRVCGGLPPGVHSEDDACLREAEFELTSALRKRWGVKRQWSSGSGRLREPLMCMDQLVLHDDLRRSLDEAVQHARQPARLLDDWGLRQVMPYGHGTTLLFAGPPGTGKTATAEAVASALEKRLLTVDYSAVQSCWVGETEKQIVRAFREAADEDAVLFWDEADAMFYDRDIAIRAWEVREVNVLLKEIEAFSGVCILATNRDVVLDPALGRRISRRLDFRAPDAAMSTRIWRLMLPADLPLAPDIDLDTLGRLCLTGGEVKNAVLNAARAAAHRGEGAMVTQADLNRAARATPGAATAIGF